MDLASSHCSSTKSFEESTCPSWQRLDQFFGVSSVKSYVGRYLAPKKLMEIQTFSAKKLHSLLGTGANISPGYLLSFLDIFGIEKSNNSIRTQTFCFSLSLLPLNALARKHFSASSSAFYPVWKIPSKTTKVSDVSKDPIRVPECRRLEEDFFVVWETLV